MDVIVVGSCNIDLISYVPRMPKVGETLHGHKFSKGFGGKGANQCIMAGRLGAKTAMVAMVGDDTFGQEYIENFKQNGIDTKNIGVTKEAATGVAPITVTDDGRNSIVIVCGANMKLKESDILKAEALIKSAKVMVCQLEIQTETTKAALKLGMSLDVMTILNPAPGSSDLDPEIYQYCDIFCPNETEAELLVGKPVTDIKSAANAIEELQLRGCRTVIITMGQNGAVYATKENPQAVHVPARVVQPVDTTGAGDAFIGGLAFYLSKYPDLGLKESIRRAGEIATWSVLSPGTQKSYRQRKDLPSELF